MPSASESPVRCFEADLARVEHRRAVTDLVDMYAHEPLARGSGLPREVLARLPEFLRTFPTAHVFLAESRASADDRVESYLGVAVCVRTFTTFAAAAMMNVHDLAVRPGRRGKGIGRALLAEVQRRALELGCVRLSLEVHRDNAGAIAAYRNFGFADGEKTNAPGEIWYFVKQL